MTEKNKDIVGLYAEQLEGLANSDTLRVIAGHVAKMDYEHKRPLA